MQDLGSLQQPGQLFSSAFLWQHGPPAFSYILALFSSLCTWWERHLILSTSNELARFAEPHSNSLERESS